MRMRVLRKSPFVLPLVLLLTAVLWSAPAPAQDDDAQDDESPSVEQTERIQVGDEAPGFALPDLDGEVHRLADLRGKKPLILVFFRGAW